MAYSIKEFLRDMGLFFQGATDFDRKSKGMLENEYIHEMDEFMLLCFSDILGLPLPINYYTLELSPYLTEELEAWIIRMDDKKTIWEKKGAQMDFDA